VLVACTRTGSHADRARSTTTTRVAVTTASGGGYGVPSLRVRFTLPPSFVHYDEPDFAFLARSTDPKSVFSIERDSADVIDHRAERGETLVPMAIDGHRAVLVQHARIDGLLPGVVGNELLVANGTRSFSVIMSAYAPSFPPLWAAFAPTVHIDG